MPLTIKINIDTEKIADELDPLFEVVADFAVAEDVPELRDKMMDRVSQFLDYAIERKLISESEKREIVDLAKKCIAEVEKAERGEEEFMIEQPACSAFYGKVYDTIVREAITRAYLQI
mgnify:CR=1 FL=1